MFKILQARLQQYVSHELPDGQARFRKGRGTRDQIANIHWIIEKARELQKNIYFCLIDYAKLWTMWITANFGKFWKRREYQAIWPASWEICMQVKKQQLELEVGKVVWYSHLFQNFPQFVVIHTVKGFGVVNKAKLDIFLELSCFFNDPAGVGNLISGSSAFSKSSLTIWKFTVHVLSKPGLENFEHYFASMWDECSCVVVSA